MTNAVLTEIERAKQREKIEAWNKAENAMAEQLAKEMPSEVQTAFSPVEAELWQDFVGWCADRRVRYLPARPSTVATYLRDRNFAHGAMLNAIIVITRKHDLHPHLGNP